MRKRRLQVVGLASLGLLAAVPGYSADHRDSPEPTMNPAADINDVYAWVPSAGRVALAMTVSPFAEAGATFGDGIQYIFHVGSSQGYGMPQTNVTIVCTFSPNQRVQCWAGDDVYVEGDASVEGGITSEDGSMTVFTGLRDDPFFFNLNGFQSVAATVTMVAPALMYDPNGCPTVDAATSAALVNQLGSEPNGMPAQDDFAGANTLAIVVEIDAGKVTPGGPIIGVWASTNMNP